MDLLCGNGVVSGQIYQVRSPKRIVRPLRESGVRVGVARCSGNHAIYVRNRAILMAQPLYMAQYPCVIGAISCFNGAISANRAIKKGVIMAKRRVKDIAEDLAAVVDFVRQSPDGARSSEIAKALKEVPQRTLQRWLKSLGGGMGGSRRKARGRPRDIGFHSR